MKERSELFWSRYLGGELGWWERRRLARAMERDPALRREHDRLLESRRAFDGAARRKTDLAALTQRFAGEPERARSLLRFALPVGALAAGMAAWMVMQPTEEELVTKGGPAMHLMVLRDGRAQPLEAECRAGDRVGASLSSPFALLLILGFDDRGQVDVLYPLGAESSGPFPERGLTPDSWELDDSPGEQRFVAIFSDRAVEVSSVRGDLERGAIPVLEDAAVLEQRCRKVAP